MHPSRVLLPLRGPRDERALNLAADVASRFEVTLALFAAVEDPHEVDQHQEHLDAVLGRVHERHAAMTVTSEVTVDPHGPDAIADRCDGLTLPVMATSTRPFIHAGYLGSAAEHVIRRTERPVLMVGPSVDGDSGLSARRIIVPIDGSELGEEAVQVAAVWARVLELPLWLASVVGGRSCADSDDEEPAATTARLRELAGRSGAQWEVLHASAPADALVSAAGSDGLVIMSSHGRTGIRRLALGSVAAELTRHAACPVMVIAPKRPAERPARVLGDIGGSDGR